MPDLLRRQVNVVHYAVIRHDRKSFIFVVKGDGLRLVVYFDLCHAEVVVKILEDSLQESETGNVSWII